MDVNLNLYKSFYYVAFYKSFTVAADKLLTSQPSLSYNVKKLEEEMDIILLTRRNGDIKLTEEGELLFESLENVFNELRYIETSIMNSRLFDGTIHIAVRPLIASTLLWKCLKTFKDKYPRVKINITIRTSHAIYERLDSKRTDLIIDHLPMKEFKTKVEQINLTTYHNNFICSREFFDKYINKPIITFQELSELPLALPFKTRRRRELDTIAGYEGVKLISAMESYESDYIYQAIRENYCVAYIASEAVKDKLASGEFVD